MNKEKFDGNIYRCEEDFIETIKDLMNDIFKNLKPKRKMNGEIMSLKEVGEHFRVYAEIFARDDAPKTGNIVEVSAMCHYRTQIAGAKNDLDEIIRENFIFEEMKSFDDMEDMAELCLKKFEEKAKRRKFINPHVYALKFSYEAGKILAQKLREARTHYYYKHSKEIIEEYF